MTIKSHADNLIIVELPPEPDIRKELDTLMELLRAGTGCDVLIDFSRVNIMTSMALSGFMQLRKLMIDLGRHLIFCNATSITKDIFRVTCFEGIFEFVDDKAEALGALRCGEKCTQTTD